MSSTSTLSPEQINIALRRQPASTKKQPENFPYDYARYDDALEGMFGRRWDDLEVFPPRAKEIWSALFRCTIGGTFTLEEVSMLLAVAQNTRSESLRTRAIGGLRDYVVDCTGTNPALKPAAQKLLYSLTATAPATSKEQDEQPRT